MRSRTDPDAVLARKGEGKKSKLSYSGNLLVENRHGLIMETEVVQAAGTAARDPVLGMTEQIPGTLEWPVTLTDVVVGILTLRSLNSILPTKRGSAIP